MAELRAIDAWVSAALDEVRGMRRALALKYNPDQPRVPAGNGRESGRWTYGGEGGAAQTSESQTVLDRSAQTLQVAGDLLMICVSEGFGTAGTGAFVYTFGNFRCPNGASWRWEQRGRWTVPHRVIIPWFEPARRR